MREKNSAPFLLFVIALLPALLPGQAFDGLTLYNTMSSRTTRLITNDGQTVKSWACNSNVAYMPYLMPDSTIWRPGVYSGASLRPAAYGGLIEQYAWNGSVLRSFVWSSSNYIQHHDIQPMPNGNVLLVSIDRYTRAEAQARGRTNISPSYIWSEMIVEYDPVADSVVWVWKLWDHLIQDVDPQKPNYGVIRDHPERFNINVGSVSTSGDWIHANAVDYWEEEDLIVFCSHTVHEFFVIDHSTTTEEARGSTGGRRGKGGDILYRWGNPQNYGRGTADDRRFFVVHGVNFIRPGLPGEGNVLIFNNGDRPGSGSDYSSVEEIVLPWDSSGTFYIHPDSAFGPTEPVWMYSNPGTFYSNHLSGAFRLPNGNTFMVEGTKGKITEVTADKQVVLTYNIGSQTGRAIKYPRDFATGAKEPETRPTVASLLGPIAPNPFSQAASIRYNLPGAGRLAISLLDASGRVVEFVECGRKAAGPHTARFAPRALAAGVYFVRLEARLDGSAERYVETRTIVKGR